MSTGDPTTETSTSAETSTEPQPLVERLSDGLQNVIKVLVGSNRKPPRLLKSLLNGTWLGHPLHPVITDIPITSWILAAVFDVIWLISPTSFSWAARGAEIAIMERGSDLPLPPDLSSLYGRLAFPPHPDRAHVIGNFVTTLDGVVSLNEPGHAGGADISGFNHQDRMVMGLLRAIADVVIVGAGTLRAEPNHRWTAQYIYPSLAEEYSLLRTSLGKSAYPLNVIVTASGAVNLNLPVFRSREIPVLIVTSPHGLQSIPASHVPSSVHVTAVESEDTISAQDILKAVSEVHRSDMILVEGGPQLMGDFFAEQCLDELFLTLAPQIAGRDSSIERPGFVAGKSFAPEHPIWGTLVSVRRGGSHLFLRYVFETQDYA